MTMNPSTSAGAKPRPQYFIACAITYPPSIAKPPWARWTKPIKPIVTESPTDTMNSPMPAATPPRTMLATSPPKTPGASYGRSPGFAGTWIYRRASAGGAPAPRRPAASTSLGSGSARADLLLLAGVLDPVDLADHLLVDAAILHHRLGQVLVHDDVARDGIDHDRAARARELPPFEGFERGVDLDLALERLGDVHDRRHAVVAAHCHEVGRGAGAVLILPRLHEALVLGVVDIGVGVVHREQAYRGPAHRLALRVRVE